MNKVFFGAVLLLGIVSLYLPAQSLPEPTAPPPATDVVDSTRYFHFHSNLWINMNHFLFKIAKNHKSIPDDSLSAQPIFEGLSAEDKSQFAEILRYYRDNLIEKDLAFSGYFYRLKSWMAKVSLEDTLAVGEFEKEHIDLLNRYKPLYIRHFWDTHHQRNMAVLAENREMIRKFEENTVTQLSKLTREKWPDQIRVDISYYANWAGAYTTNRPAHVVTSTADRLIAGDWIETLFHEASHTLIGRRRGAISNAITSVAEKLELQTPRGLWHGILFYLAGRVIQDQLNANGIDYELYMVREKVFDSYYPHLVKHVEPYISGDAKLFAMVENLIVDISAEAKKEKQN